MSFFRSYKNKTDEQLMVFVQGGDPRAFSIIYDRYAARMKAFFHRMLWSDKARAEDFVHDLFTKLVERPELYNANRPFSSWFFQVASNMCKNAYRKRQFEIAYLSRLESEDVEMPAAGRHLDEQFIMDWLHVVLEQLEEGKRELFLLRYQQQLSIKELAETLQISEGTVKSRLFYIKKALLEKLNEEKII